jgi:hypothetical protein
LVRILAFTDPHGEKKALRQILALAEDRGGWSNAAYGAAGMAMRTGK